MPAIRVIPGDCREVLRTLSPSIFDACITDPPYALTTANGRSGFMGARWDTGEAAFNPALWRLVFAALKPGAHLLAFGGTRTFHRLAVAIEDAGFEIRDTIAWLYGNGFPKSHDIAKDLDRKGGGMARSSDTRPP